MQVYGLTSYCLTIITSILLIYIYKREKFLLVKPSIWFVGFFHIFIQWSASIYHEDVFLRLDLPYRFLILTQVVPLTIICVSRLTFRKHSFRVWWRFSKTLNKQLKYGAKSTMPYALMGLSLCLSIVAVYLFFVPLTTTGLYVGLTSDNPLLMSIARENSMKLLPITWLKYLFSFLEKFLAPLTSSLMTLTVISWWKEGKYLFAIVGLVSIVIVVFGVMLPGPRLNGVLVLLCSLLTGFFLNIKSVNLLKYFVFALLILIPAVLLQMQKYTDVQQDLFLVALEEVLLRRALYVPMEAGINWLGYVEEFGFWGPAGIPKLAGLMGVEAINVPNYLMNYYFDYGEKTGYMTASFVFSYYCYFGPISIPFLILGVLLLDFWVIGYRLIAERILLSAIITLNLICMVLTSSDYLTLFISYGFLTGLIFLLLVSGLSKKKVGVQVSNTIT